MSTLKFKTNINCSGCIKSVTPHLDKVDSINNWNVNTESQDKVLTVESENGSAEDVKTAVKKAGFNIEELS